MPVGEVVRGVLGDGERQRGVGVDAVGRRHAPVVQVVEDVGQRQRRPEQQDDVRRHHGAPDDRRRDPRRAQHAPPATRCRGSPSARVRSAWSIGGLAGSDGQPVGQGAHHPAREPALGGAREERRPLGGDEQDGARQADDGAHRRGAERRCGGPRGDAGPASNRAPRQARHLQGNIRARARHVDRVGGGHEPPRSTRLASRAAHVGVVLGRRGQRPARARGLERGPRELAAGAALAGHLAARVADPDDAEQRRRAPRGRPRSRRPGGRRSPRRPRRPGVTTRASAGRQAVGVGARQRALLGLADDPLGLGREAAGRPGAGRSSRRTGRRPRPRGRRRRAARRRARWRC